MNAIETPDNHAEEAAYATGAVPEAEAPTARNWKPLGIGVSIAFGLAIVFVLVWKFLSYAPFVLPSAIAIGHIILKDWDSYKSTWKRSLILSIILAAAVGGVAYQSHQLQEKDAAEARYQVNIEGLKGKADAALTAQKNNAEVFTKSFGALSGELSNLKTKVATEALQKQIASLQSKLDDTQKALAPAPKASLEFTFLGFKNPKPGEPFVPVREITLPATAEGLVKISIIMVNATEADAMQGHINFFICDLCKFAKEPTGMSRAPSMPEQARDFPFPQILAADSISDIILEVIIPRGLNVFKIGVQHRCRTCVLQKEAIYGIVHVNWP